MVVGAKVDEGGPLAPFNHKTGDPPRSVGQAREVGVRHPRPEADIDAFSDEPPLERYDHRVVLVVLRAPDARQRVQAGELLDKPQEIAPQLRRGVPSLERERRPPHAPEAGREEVLAEQLVDPARPERSLAQGEQAHDLEPVDGGEPVLRGVDDAVLAVDEARPSVRLHFMVEVNHLPSHGDRRVLQRGDGVEEIVGAHVRLVREHPAAAGDPCLGARRRARAVHGSTGDVQLFEDVDVSRANVGVAKRERGGGHSRDASADDP